MLAPEHTPGIKWREFTRLRSEGLVPIIAWLVLDGQPIVIGGERGILDSHQTTLVRDEDGEATVPYCVIVRTEAGLRTPRMRAFSPMAMAFTVADDDQDRFFLHAP